MCNRYRMTAKQADLAARYGVDPIYPEDVTFPPPELFPKTPAWIVRTDAGARILDVMPWGVPTQVPGKRIDKETGKLCPPSAPMRQIEGIGERRILVSSQ